MTVARILFLARYRVPHACFALQWDHYLQGIDYTIVSSPVPKEELWPVFHKYGIDTAKFKYLSDAEVLPLYTEIENWVFPDDYRGWWLRQQALKLSVLDYVKEDVMLMHDPDTFMIEPYRCYHDGKLNLLALLNTTQGSYEGVFEAITGFPRTSQHCFVTELVPVRKADWISLRNHIWSRWPNKHWLDGIIDAVPGMPTVPPWGNGNIIKWFSEYEFVSNWAVKCGCVEYQAQRRYEYDNLEKLGNLTKDYNAVCDAVPDLSMSMQFDWSTLTVPSFDHYRAMVDRALNASA